MISSQRINSKVFPLLGLIITLSFAYLLDRWIDMLKINLSMNYETQIFFVTIPIIHLLFAGWILLLFWFINYKCEPSRLVAIIYLVVGLLFPFYNALAPFISSWSLPRSIISLSYLGTILGPTSFLTIICAFITVIGFWGLLAKRIRK